MCTMRQLVHSSTDDGDVPIIETEFWKEFMSNPEGNRGNDSNKEA
jgi:hypothetical protein